MQRSFRYKNRLKPKKLQPTHNNIIRRISKLGVASRRQACEWVLAGRVRVNGKIVLDPGTRVGETDRIRVDGQPAVEREKIYLLFHKPRGCVTTRKDEKGRKTVYDYLRAISQWVFPVGRLDQDSEGLLIFTNDTVFGEKLTNPIHRIARVYEVTLAGLLSGSQLQQIREGVFIGHPPEKVRPASISAIGHTPDLSRFRVTVAEGRNREIRRLFEAVGARVQTLTRTHFGPFRLGTLKPGEYRRIHVSSESFAGLPANIESRNPARRTPRRPR